MTFSSRNWIDRASRTDSNANYLAIGFAQNLGRGIGYSTPQLKTICGQTWHIDAFGYSLFPID
jgi:hypothetical protein